MISREEIILIVVSTDNAHNFLYSAVTRRIKEHLKHALHVYNAYGNAGTYT